MNKPKHPSFFPRATGAAQILTGKKVRVIAGDLSNGPCTDHKNIMLGESLEWDVVDRFAVVLHEVCHIKFPAKYPPGNLHQLANLIDDCRIERQFLHERPQYTEAFQHLAINVIANGKYAKPDPKTKQIPDPWDPKNFDPCLWALLFFRSYLPDDVRLAATDAITAYAKGKGYDKDQTWGAKFDKLVKDGQQITRLKKVSQATLQAWCEQYYAVFPEAKKDANQVIGIKILGDNPNGQDGQDSEGEGDEGDDKDMAKKASSKAGQDKGKGQKQNQGDPGEAKAPEDLEGACDKLKERIKKVGTEKERQAKENVGEEAEDTVGKEAGQEEGPREEGVQVGDEQYENLVRGGRPGRGDPLLASELSRQSVSRDFVNRIKVSVRKLQTLVEDRAEQDRKSGKLNLKAIIRADRLGILPTKPFRKDSDALVHKPVACCVATDFSGSTSGEMNTKLNEVSHNILFGLQSAGCECAEVVWNSGATITKTLDQQVSPLAYKRHSSDGGTELMAACLGSIKALETSKAKRKVVFIFTDGAVNHSELAPISHEFKRRGVEGVLLVSLGSQVPRYDIVDTETINSIEQLAGVFDRWVRKQIARALISQENQ